MGVRVPPAVEMGFFEFSAIPCDPVLGCDTSIPSCCLWQDDGNEWMSSPFFYVLHILPAVYLLDGESPVIILHHYSFLHLEALPAMILSLHYHECTSWGDDPALNLLIYCMIPQRPQAWRLCWKPAQNSPCFWNHASLFTLTWQDTHSCSPGDIETWHKVAAMWGTVLLPLSLHMMRVFFFAWQWLQMPMQMFLLIQTKSKHPFLGTKSVFQRAVYVILKLFMGSTQVWWTVLQEEAFRIRSAPGTRGWVPFSFIPRCSPARTFHQNKGLDEAPADTSVVSGFG